MTNSQFNEETLIAYLQGELDAPMAAAVEEWYDASEENRKRLGEIYYLLSVNDRVQATAGIEVEQALATVKQRIASRRRSRIPQLLSRIAVAAAIVLVLAGGVMTYRLSKQVIQPVTVLTHLGERSQVILPDGTKVWLNSCSRVEYVSSFFSRKRNVKMEGEAYFEVAHDKHAPFSVCVDGLNIEVLGTRFNVRSDRENHSVTTVLLEGSVMAYAGESRSSSVRLRPSQRLYYDTQTGSMHLSEDPAAEHSICWIDGRFSFERNTLEQIASELERYYNVDVVFRNEALRGERFSGEFRVEDGIYHIMSVLRLTNKFNYKITDNTIEISANQNQ